VNHPRRFLHFALLGGLRIPPHQLDFGYSPARQRPLGRLRLGGERGMLYREIPYSRGGGVFADHYTFIWRRRGIEYVASLHSWDRSQTVALLGALIAKLEPMQP
jgi:hypothetical protein